MNPLMLAVDKNIELSSKIQAEWLKRGIATVRVNTMQDAIDALTKESFLFAAINADNINFKPLLKIMSDISPVPVFIMTSNFTVRDQTEAFRLGADGYAPFNEKGINETIDSALVLLQRINERDCRQKKTPRYMILNNLFVSRSFRKVFYNDIEIEVTKTEFNILWYLMSNRDYVLSYKQIYRKIWGIEYDAASNGVLHQHIFRLREKIIKATGHEWHIESEQGVGYRFSTTAKTTTI